MPESSGNAATVPRSAIARLPTGTKVFLILSFALLPLALIAFFASLQTTRVADVETRARLRVASTEGARALANELVGDMTVLRVVMKAMDADPSDIAYCARARGVFTQQTAAGTRFAIRGADGRLLCGEPLNRAPPATPDDKIHARFVSGQGVILSTGGAANSATASAFFPIEFLGRTARPTGFMPPYAAVLRRDGGTLTLKTLASRGPLDRREHISVPLGVDAMSLELSVRSAPITSPIIVTMLLPLLMWAAAAGIGWFVVDRLLIRPLRALRRDIDAYRPGEYIEPSSHGSIPAEEIRELGDTFRDLSRTVMLHEADLAEGLLRQTRLTREVHHRVKNNLQVIASLINFHSRSAREEDAGEAYATIQRRVDALAVVHRHHFAELEVNNGLELRSVIGELASNLRATAPHEASGFSITLDLDPFLVSQDTAVAVSFLVTELVELAMKCNPSTTVNISLKPSKASEMAALRVSSPALVDGPALEEIQTRYGRVISGLARQLRGTLHHEPLTGAYEIDISVNGVA